ncbi:flagellar hook-length control protein FliK [Hydrogenophaga sp. 5NK40-0174]|uniref:flagellar hook-length control protein FliK n=1 Tax=Hydrogenophaga sp. 5NK40-0174 TaxID=3127649 RepID=UPI0031046FED
MSTASSATQATSAAAAAGHRTHGHVTGQDTPGDVFSNLLSLLSATHDGDDAALTLSAPDDEAQGDMDAPPSLTAAPDDATPLPTGSPSGIAAAVMSGWPLSPAAVKTPGSHELAASRQVLSQLSQPVTGKEDLLQAAPGKALADASQEALPQVSAMRTEGEGTAKAQPDVTPLATESTASRSSKPGIDTRALGMQTTAPGQRMDLPPHGATAMQASQTSAAASTQAVASGQSAVTNTNGLEAGVAPAPGSEAAGAEAGAEAGKAAPPAQGVSAQQKQAARLKAHAPANAQVSVTTQSWRSTTSLTPGNVAAASSGRLNGFAARGAEPGTAASPAAGESATRMVEQEAADIVRPAADTQTGGQSSARQGDQRPAALPEHLASQLPDSAAESTESDAYNSADKLPEAQDPLATADAEEEISPELGRWGANQVRQATLRVGDSASDAIDIQLRMNGQEAQVSFRTDNAEARASLEQNANESLQDMLGRSGIQLSDVSVSGQHQDGSQASQQGNGQPGSSQNGSAHRSGDRHGEAEAVAPQTARPVQRRSDGSEPLDLFV